mmetsp:Transcript_26166/g.25345  ORF Transcript_26166/g.25345 Transcript_26166/m.25345 type:complete len:352 (-) Transcript_26166:164-1219(-)
MLQQVPALLQPQQVGLVPLVLLGCDVQLLDGFAHCHGLIVWVLGPQLLLKLVDVDVGELVADLAELVILVVLADAREDTSLALLELVEVVLVLVLLDGVPDDVIELLPGGLPPHRLRVQRHHIQLRLLVISERFLLQDGVPAPMVLLQFVEVEGPGPIDEALVHSLLPLLPEGHYSLSPPVDHLPHGGQEVLLPQIRKELLIGLDLLLVLPVQHLPAQERTDHLLDFDCSLLLVLVEELVLLLAQLDGPPSVLDHLRRLLLGPFPPLEPRISHFHAPVGLDPKGHDLHHLVSVPLEQFFLDLILRESHQQVDLAAVLLVKVYFLKEGHDPESLLEPPFLEAPFLLAPFSQH